MFSDALKFIQKAAIIHPDGNAVLLLRRGADDAQRPDDWDLPGGNVDWGELHDVALMREVKEETGTELTEVRPLIVKSWFNQEENQYALFIFYAGKAKSENIQLSEEHSAFHWFSIESLQNLASESPYAAIALEAIIRK